MPRSYSSKFLLTLNKPEAVMTGQVLAKVCVEANLPASYVHKVFGISSFISASFASHSLRIRSRSFRRVINVSTN